MNCNVTQTPRAPLRLLCICVAGLAPLLSGCDAILRGDRLILRPTSNPNFQPRTYPGSPTMPPMLRVVSIVVDGRLIRLYDIDGDGIPDIMLDTETGQYFEIPPQDLNPQPLPWQPEQPPTSGPPYPTPQPVPRFPRLPLVPQPPPSSSRSLDMSTPTQGATGCPMEPVGPYVVQMLPDSIAPEFGTQSPAALLEQHGLITDDDGNAEVVNSVHLIEIDLALQQIDVRFNWSSAFALPRPLDYGLCSEQFALLDKGSGASFLRVRVVGAIADAARFFVAAGVQQFSANAIIDGQNHELLIVFDSVVNELAVYIDEKLFETIGF